MGNQSPMTEYLLDGKGFKSVTAQRSYNAIRTKAAGQLIRWPMVLMRNPCPKKCIKQARIIFMLVALSRIMLQKVTKRTCWENRIIITK